MVENACIAWDWAGCTVCVDECPVEGALRLDEHSRPVVDEALFDGCGKCELKCPAASLRAYDAATLEKGSTSCRARARSRLWRGMHRRGALERGRGVAAQEGAIHA